MKKGVQFKVLLTVALLIALTLTGFAAFQYFSASAQSNRELVKNQENVVARLQISLVGPIWNMDSDEAKKLIQAEMKDARVSSIVVFEEADKKKVFAGMGRDEKWEPVTIQEPVASSDAVISADIIRDEKTIGQVSVGVTRTFLQAALRGTLMDIIVAGIITILTVVVGLTFLLRLLVVKPIDIFVSHLKELARGDFRQGITLTQQDEFGLMAREINGMRTSISGMIQGVLNDASEILVVSEQLNDITNVISQNANRTSEKVNVVSTEAQNVATNIDSVAAASEEMVSTITEISTNTAQSATMATNAVEAVGQTNILVQTLGNKSTQIGSIVNLINTIAEQTNLLALNATIEAARAGEAGKGFAVVANEVKELAKQTTKATEDISREIGLIQDNTSKVVGAISHFKEIVQKVSEISQTIATAVEEQTATTHEITLSVSDAAQGGKNIADNIIMVAKEAEDTVASVNQVTATTKQLKEVASRLDYAASKFQC